MLWIPRKEEIELPCEYFLFVESQYLKRVAILKPVQQRSPRYPIRRAELAHYSKIGGSYIVQVVVLRRKRGMPRPFYRLFSVDFPWVLG